MLKRQALGRCEADGVVLASRTKVRQLLRLHRVYFQVIWLGIFADDHAFIQGFAWRDHQDAALFQWAKGVSNGFARAVGNQHAVFAAFNMATMRAIFFKQAVHDARTARVGQEFAMITN